MSLQNLVGKSSEQRPGQAICENSVIYFTAVKALEYSSLQYLRILEVLAEAQETREKK